MPQNAQIQLRRDTAANWTSVNPVLALGEMGLETDTRKSKFGDGTTAWTGLSYTTSTSVVPDPIVPADGTQNITGALAVSGTITASNLSGSSSGTNTGDQTITLTGPVTGSGTGSFATTITNGAVTLAKQADVATASVFYRKTAGTGAPEVQTLATLKTDLGLTGTNTGDQTSIVGITGTTAQFNTALTDNDFATGGGTVTGTSSGTNTGDQTTITGNAGTATALQNSRNFSISGSGITAAAVAFNGTANVVLAASVDANHITLARMATVATASVFYRKTAGTGDPEVQTLATLKTDLGLTGTNSGDQTITLTSDVTGSGTGSFATTIAAGVVTLAKMANIATDRLIGRDTASTGVPEALTVGGGIEFTGSGGIQTSAFTGDATKTAGGTALTIANDAVTLAKLQNAVANSKLLGSGASGAGADYVELTLGTNLSITGTTLNASGGGTTPTGTGFTHITAGVQDAAAKLVDTADVTNNAIAFTKFVAAPSVGVVWATGAANYSHNASGGGTANFLRADGTWSVPPGGGGYTPPTGTGFPHITSGSQDAAAKLVDTADINDAQVTLAKLANMATASLYYRKTASSGAPEVNSLATLKTDLGLTGTNSGDQTITLTGNVTGSGTGSFATTIASGVVTLAMQANMATASVVYRKTAGSGAPEVQTLATLKTDLGLTGTNSGDQTITLTSDVTGSGSGSFATTIANNAVSFTKFVAAPSAGVVWATGAGNYSHNASGGGTTNYLRADGTWAAPAGGGGGVTSFNTRTGAVTLTGADVSTAGAATTFAIGDTSGTVLTLGNTTGASTATPVTIDMGGTYSNASGSNLKIKLYNDGASVFGIGVASGALDYVASGASTHKFFLGASVVAGINSAGVAVTGTLSATSTVTGSNLSGTNTGDQTITLTGNVTGSGTGSFATTIATGVVTRAMMSNMATNRILGRTTAGSGVPEELTGAQAIAITGAAPLIGTVSAKTGTYTLAQGDNGNFITMNGTTLTLNCANLTATTVVVIRNIHATSPVTVALNSCTLYKNGSTTSAAGTLAAGGVISMMCWGSSVWTATGSGLT